MKVRWTKQTSNSTAYLEVYENGVWVHYKNSKIYKPDIVSSSAGFATFVNGLNKGYETDGLFVKSQ